MNWYLGYIRSKREFDVADALERAGFNVWCGRVTARRRGVYRGKRHTVFPALPNYIFMQLSDDQFYTVHDPIYLQRDGWDKPQEVGKYLAKAKAFLGRAGEVEFKRFRASIEHLGVLDQFQPGVTVEVTGGSLTGQMAMLKRLSDDEERAVIQLSLLGRSDAEAQVAVSDLTVRDPVSPLIDD